jgi:N-acetylmuramoyl-L-alanine amidase
VVELVAAPSPNFNARVGPPDMVVLHYTGMQSGEAALERLRDPQAQVSAHYLIEEDGRTFTLVDEARRAWHAGVSCWGGERDINGCSIGIELVNPGHEFGYRDFPQPQIAVLIALLSEIRERWTVPDARILGHSDIAPRRKQDPGERFGWKRLAKAGHGLWVEPSAAPGPSFSPGDEGFPVAMIRNALARIGYDCPPGQTYDDDLAVLVAAFQRHWRPSLVDGRADGDTRARLMALLRAA